MERLSETVVRNSTFSLLGQGAIKVLSFCFSVFVVRKLGEISYGQYSTVLAYVGVFAIFSDLGLAVYALREMSKDEKKISYLFTNVVILRLILSTFTVILTTCSAVLLGRSPELVLGIFIASCGLFLYAVQGPLDAILMARERLDYSALFNVVNQLAFVILGTIVLVFGYGFIGLVVVSFCGVLAMAGLSLAVVRHRLGGLRWQPDPKMWLHILRTAVPFGVIGLTLGLSYKLDTVLLQLFRGDAETGWYNAAYNLIFMVATVSNSINVSLFPTMARQYAATPHKMAPIYEQTLKYLFLLVIPIAVGVTVLADKIVLFLYTSEFTPSVLPMRILFWVLPLMFLSEFLGNVMVIRDQEKLVARSIAVSTAVNLVLNLVLIPRFGLIAASIVTVLTEGVLVAQYVWLLRHELAAMSHVAAFLKPILAAAIMGIVLVALRGWHLLVLVGLAAVIYLAGLFLSGAIGRQELELFRRSFGRPRVGVQEKRGS